MLNIVLMGPPGAGKGTQAVTIADEFKIPHISTGDMFREAIAKKTELGLKAKEIIDAGNLVPDELTVGLVRERLSQKDCENGYLLDGFPRTIPQAEALTKMGEEIGRPVTLVINIDLADEVLLERISGRRVCPKCGASYHIVNRKPLVEGICDRCGSELIQRKDDNAESFKVRLENYYKSTKPLLDYYQRFNLLHEFDGGVGYNELHDAISKLLKETK